MDKRSPAMQPDRCDTAGGRVADGQQWPRHSVDHPKFKEKSAEVILDLTPAANSPAKPTRHPVACTGVVSVVNALSDHLEAGGARPEVVRANLFEGQAKGKAQG